MWGQLVKIVTKFAAKLSTYSIFSFAGYEIGQTVGSESSPRTTIEIKSNSAESKSESLLLPLCLLFCAVIVIIIFCACFREIYFTFRNKGNGVQDNNNNNNNNNIVLSERRITKTDE